MPLEGIIKNHFGFDAVQDQFFFFFFEKDQLF
jgi:hypothetical protein